MTIISPGHSFRSTISVSASPSTLMIGCLVTGSTRCYSSFTVNGAGVISLDLLSLREKETKIRNFAAEFSAEKRSYKFFSISRPVDIERLISRLTMLLSDSTDPVQKEILKAETS